MTTSAATLTFAGAAGTVTGSKHLLEWGKSRVLLDCGLFQGLKELRLRNWRPPPFDPRSVDAVVLSHAHLDHAGYLPVLVRQGFDGPVHCTAASGDLLEVLLRDAARLQEEDAARANRYGYTRHRPALPLFTEADVERVRVMLHDAETKLARAQQLSERQLIPANDLDAAAVARRTAEAQVKAAEAQATQARAALKQSEVNLGKTVIASPIDGIVISRSVDVGQTVAASLQAPTLFTLAADLGQIRTDDDQPGLATYDPGFVNTASTKSAVTFIDGDQGILEYRGYPIEQLAEKSTFLEVAYLLIHGELPTKEQYDRFQALAAKTN